MEAVLVDGVRDVDRRLLETLQVVALDLVLVELKCSPNDLMLPLDNSKPRMLLSRLNLQADAS